MCILMYNTKMFLFCSIAKKGNSSSVKNPRTNFRGSFPMKNFCCELMSLYVLVIRVKCIFYFFRYIYSVFALKSKLIYHHILIYVNHETICFVFLLRKEILKYKITIVLVLIYKNLTWFNSDAS